VSSSDPGKYNPDQPTQAALAALAKSVDAQPQFLVLPNASQGTSPDQGEGPGGGYTPQQIAGAYGVGQIQYGSIIGNGAGQTIAIVDAYGNPDFVSTSDPNFDSSALHIFDQYYGLPDPHNFQIYDEYGNVGGTGEGDVG
jgi:kumamolisin